MATLPILKYPDPRLATLAKEVQVVDDSMRTLVADMFDTMYAAQGIGLAATQVDQHLQVVVMDLSEEKNEPRVFINPKITVRSSDKTKGQEGCLSVPGIYDDVERHTSVTVQALDENGKNFELEADGLLAICIQHEIDHLNGRVFVQHLSRMKQGRILNKIRKAEKHQGN